MTRQRYDGLTAFLAAPLSAGDTNVTFTTALVHDGGTPVPTMNPGDVIPLSLLTADHELSEIVYLTAYTTGANTGTLLRGVEGTTATTHATGLRVISAPTVLDYSDLAAGSTAHASALLVSKLQADQGDASLLFVADSSGAIYGTPWTTLIAQYLADEFPSYTVEVSQFNGNAPTPDPGTWDAPVTLQVGTGSNTLRVWNGSVGSTNTRYPLTQLDTMIIEPAPDLVFISYGANELATSATHTPDDIRAAILCLIGTIKESVSAAPLAWVSQQPVTAGGAADSYMVAEVARQACMATGTDYYNMTQVFADLGADISDYLQDGTHCNQLGQDLWAATIRTRAFNLSIPTPGPQLPSTFIQPAGENLLVNGQFAAFDPPTQPTGWLASNVTLAKDTTNRDGSNGNAYALSMTSTGGGGLLLQAVNAATLARVQGKYVTLCARVRPDSPAASGSSQRGTVWLNDGVTFVQGIPDVYSDDQFVYHAVTLLVDPAAASLTAYLVCDNSAAVGTVNQWEWATLVEGILPTIPSGLFDLVATALAAHITDPTNAHAASAIGNTPAGNVAATDVQAAINELDTEKAKLSQVTQFTATGTDTAYTIPTGAIYLLVRCAGAGGGGGGGRRGLATQICTAGGGGGGGGYTEKRVRVADLTALGVTQLFVDVGAGGAGGTSPAGAGGSTQNGNDGATGGTSNVKTASGAASTTNVVTQSTGGGPGVGGANSTGGAGGTGGLGEWYGACGNLSNTNASVNSFDCPSGFVSKSAASQVESFGPPGGGGGGSVNAAGTQRVAGGGGYPNGRMATVNPGGAADTAGTNGSNPPCLGPGYGGSGGGGSVTTGRNGGNGGKAAGGGGGGALQTAGGGAGGTGGIGGDGFVEIEAIF